MVSPGKASRKGGSLLTYFLAFLAACANAAASVLQRKANRNEPGGDNLSLRLVAHLLHRPVWFAGVLAVTVGFILQATALGGGQLSVVEPILASELPITLILAAVVFHSRLRRREWGSALAMTAGLVGLLYFLSPSPGRSENIAWYTWVFGLGINLGVIAALVAVGRVQSGPRRAALLGTAAGAGFGLTAALMKGMTNAFSHGFPALFTSWELYAMIIAGALSMFLLQSAMNAGRLLAAQPGITLTDPVVSILWGVLAFQEGTRGGVYLLLAVLAGLVMSVAVLSLTRSPLLQDDEAGRTEEDQREQRSAPGRTPSDDRLTERPSRVIHDREPR
ncbi:MAG: DMT family transporter [Acidimicrobiaceae bacterium]|nr:DMT family transporter [Acidimicrobiaceae bacterium]